jgi:ATP-dependent DNA ligase
MIYFPPKPTLMTIDQPLFDELEMDGRYVAELKFNGDHLILKRMADKSFEFWNRHGKKFKYDPSTELLDHLNSLDWRGECVCDGELLHHKVRETKHMIVLWDIFMFDDISLVDQRYFSRHQILETLFQRKRYLDLWISDQWKTGWREIYTKETQRKEIEGLVLKRIDNKFELGRSSSPIVKYMYKVRKPNSSYRY